MYLGQAMGICPGLMNFQTFDTSGTPYSIYLSKCLKCFEENNGGRKHTSIMISIWKRIWFENSSLGPDATLPVILVANLLYYYLLSFQLLKCGKTRTEAFFFRWLK